ncbi:MAG: DUF1616 domain-containing protein [Candidatus Bathyarchaeota archaeon]|nr:DUF1616 domain-containing protein [Candidatus Bathyarchaeota archaeon]
MNGDLHQIILQTAQKLGQPTLSELIDSITQQKGVKFDDAAQAVYTEWKRGNLNLTTPNPATSFTSYLLSLENSGFWAVTVFLIVTTVVAFTVESSVLLFARYALGSILVFFLCGLMLMMALYPRKDDLGGVERIALSIGFSLVMVTFVGLILNYTPWGLQLGTIIVSLVVISEILAVVWVVRKFRYHMMALRV